MLHSESELQSEFRTFSWNFLKSLDEKHWKDLLLFTLWVQLFVSATSQGQMSVQSHH